MRLENATIEETLARHEHTLLELAHKMNITVDRIYREVVSGETIAGSSNDATDAC